MTTPDEHLQERLRQLPEAPLPADLWQRVNGARKRGRRQRIGIAVTALTVAAVAALSPLMRPPAPVDAAPAVAATAPSPADTDAELRALDRALQAGYARNASDAELAPLWAQRRKLLAGGDATTNTPLPRSLRI
ncbi:MAG: hypothetical protein L0H23_00160 [Luteimonas sp.]|nr:hypothetical protein [Luteimonas sp.]